MSLSTIEQSALEEIETSLYSKIISLEELIDSFQTISNQVEVLGDVFTYDAIVLIFSYIDTYNALKQLYSSLKDYKCMYDDYHTRDIL